MTLHLFYLCLDIAAILLVALVAARCLQLAPRHRNTWLIVGITIGAAAYYLSARQDYGFFVPTPFDVDWGSVYVALNLLRNATTGLFALLAWSMFSDRKRLPNWLLVLIALQMLLEEPVPWVLTTLLPEAKTQLVSALLEVVPSALQVIFLGAATYWFLKDRTTDVVELRRQVRLAVFAVYMAQVLASLGLERVAMFFGWIPNHLLYPTHVLLVLLGIVTSFAVLVSLMSAKGADYLCATNQNNGPPPKDSGSSTQAGPMLSPKQAASDAAIITRSFEEDKTYREAGLSIGTLARSLTIPEYRVRAAIHQELGYRNFNALLHHYRLSEIVAALDAEPASETPILTLALEAGYQSINPFNRAFRERFDMTPTQYRQNRQKSAPNSANSD